MNDNNRKYWENGESYSLYVDDELSDSRKDAWKQQLLNHFPIDEKKKVLDVGCGPGFFSCILAEEGHSVTGIDRSLDMLRYAEKNAEELNVHPELIQMDANFLSFDDLSFDYIVSRNVTWTFDDPKGAYMQFYRKLKHGGILLIYDANWHIPFYYPDMLKKVKENENWYCERYNREFKVYDDDHSIFENLPLSNIWRPAWDINVLSEIGFVDLSFDENIGSHVYTSWEQRLYSVTPLFEIYALKP